MQSLQPSDHTLLLNLGVFLGHPNDVIQPILQQNGYPLKEISLRIPISGYKSSLRNNAAVPDLGYSSNEKNAVLFLEAKGGGSDNDQIERFQYVKNNPSSLISTRNNLDIVKKDLILDFGILCSDIEKIKRDHAQSAIPFPVIYYNKSTKTLQHEKFNTINFSNNQMNTVFSTPLNIPRVPILFIPFGPTEFNENIPYIVKNIILLIFEANQNLKKYEKMPSIEELLLARFPMLQMMGKEEFDQIVTIINKVLRKLFQDESSTSKYNLNKYISYNKKGMLYLRRMTIRKFLERLEAALIDYENNRRQTKQVTLEFKFSQGDVLPDPEIDFEKFFSLDDINGNNS